jgi:hypothetical protein
MPEITVKNKTTKKKKEKPTKKDTNCVDYNLDFSKSICQVAFESQTSSS